VRRVLVGLAMLLLAGGVFFWWRAFAGHREQPLNAIVVLVDTLRADRLQLYGAPRETSPNLVRLAQRGVVLRRTWSQAGCTYPSVNALLTSQPPVRFFGQPGNAMGIPPDVPSLATTLRAAGWSTAAISTSPVVRATPNRVNRTGGFGAGFDSFDEACWLHPGRCINEAVERTLPALREPFFLYLHYMEPHAPYRPPAEHERVFPRRLAAKPYILRGRPRPIGAMLYRGGPRVNLTDDDRQELYNVYDEEVRYFDRLFGELMARLEADGLLERTVVVLASDHGEELLDHEEMGHCRRHAYETILGTPMVWWAPGLAPAVRDGLASNVDLAPTLLDLVGAPPLPGAEGRSLRPLLEDGQAVNQYAFALQEAMQATTDGRWKLLRNAATGESRLYDLVADPGERRDAAAEHPAVAERLGRTLSGWLRRITGGDEGRAVREALEAEEQLRAVGYL
jgi:arylsulfatase A-like enzyme